MTLRILQEAMRAYIEHRVWSEPLQQGIALQGTLAPEARLGIYRHAYYARLRERLESVYPFLHQLGGDAWFRGLVRAYAERVPPRLASVAAWGATVSQWLKTIGEAALYVDVAAFEWALYSASETRWSAPLTLAQIATIPPEEWGQLQLQWQLCWQAVDVQHEVCAWWRSEESLTGQMPLQSEPHRIVIWRGSQGICAVPLSAFETRWVDTYSATQTLEAWLARLSEWYADEAELLTHFQVTFEKGLRFGWFST